VTRQALEGFACNVCRAYRGDLFVKITTSGPRQYVKLVESCRDTAGVGSATSFL